MEENLKYQYIPPQENFEDLSRSSRIKKLKYNLSILQKSPQRFCAPSLHHHLGLGIFQLIQISF